jgi:hypothetical protein
MIKTMRRAQKSSWKPEMRPDGVTLPSERLLFPDPCLNMKSNYLSNIEWRPDGIAMSSGQMHLNTGFFSNS